VVLGLFEEIGVLSLPQLEKKEKRKKMKEKRKRSF
jgi:hypothetical protein